jgi:AmiR/NasT family two-component response regulator
MLSLSRQVGESLVLFVDYDKNPRLLALVKRLGGTADMLKGLCDEITIQYVAVWRTEKLRRGA